MKEPSQSVNVNLNAAMERLDSWIDGTVRALPNIVVALVLILVFFALSRVARKLVVKAVEARNRPELGQMMGRLAKWAVMVAGMLLGATIVIPTLNPGDIVASLGVSSVAIGFAFKDILQNWLSGMLILLRQPFEIGDQIAVGSYEGTVEHIETRATIMKTYDGQRVVIPNSEIYTSSVVVKTGHPKVRSEYDVGVGYGDDPREACRIIRETLANIPGVMTDPEPEAFPWDLAASWVTVRVRWWTKSRRADVVKARAEVIQQIKDALDEAHIDMPYETQVHLFHDQTEETDGDRSAQREGWPTPLKGKVARPRWRAERDEPQPASDRRDKAS